MSTQRKAMNTAAAAKKVIFNAPAVAARLTAVRKSVLETEGQEEAQWWKGVLDFEWASARKGNNGTQWVSLTYKDENSVSGRLVVRINGERHTGTIMPSTDQGVAEMAARVKNPNVKVEKRTKKPSVQIQKWSAQVKTAEDGITLLADEEGKPLLPSDDKLSAYYKVASLVGEAFAAEAKERIERGVALLQKAIELKKKDKGVAAQAVLDAFNAEQGARRPGDMILSSETVGAIRKVFPAAKDTETLTKGATVTSNVKVANLTQEYISDQAKKNAGLLLPNPMTRIAMNFDSTTGLAQMAFYDKGKAYLEEGRQKYEAAKVGDDPVNADNIHQFVLSRSTIDGIVNMDSVCFSNMGISMPVKGEVFVVAQPSNRDVSLDDVYDDDGITYGSADAVEQPVPQAETGAKATTEAPKPAAPKPVAAKPAAAAKKPEEDENYEDLLSDLAATTTVSPRNEGTK